MNRIARYLNRELISVSLVVLLVLLVMALGGRFVSYLQDAALGKYTADSVLTLLWLRLPEFLQLLLPFALFLSVLMTFGRLFAEQEMVVLAAGGVTTGQLVAWLAPLILAFMGLVGYLAIVVAPTSAAKFADFITEQRSASSFASFTPGQFHKYSAGGRRVTYAEAITDDRKTLLEVFMAERQDLGRTVVVRAAQATQYLDEGTAARYLLLEEGTRVEGRAGDGEYRAIRFAKMGQRVEEQPIRSRRGRTSAMSSASLRGDSHPAAVAEWQRRLGLPIFCGIAALLALGFSRVKPRQGRFARLLPAVGVFIAYYLMLTLVQNMVVDSRIPGWIGTWPVHLLFAVGAVYQLRRFGQPQYV